MTKEPKLSAAVRIVPEWKDYDNEIKDLMDKWQQELKQNTRKFII
jgi:UDP-glucose:glycoprotein glucosyltransferase